MRTNHAGIAASSHPRNATSSNCARINTRNCEFPLTRDRRRSIQELMDEFDGGHHTTTNIDWSHIPTNHDDIWQSYEDRLGVMRLGQSIANRPNCTWWPTVGGRFSNGSKIDPNNTSRFAHTRLFFAVLSIMVWIRRCRCSLRSSWTIGAVRRRIIRLWTHRSCDILVKMEQSSMAITCEENMKIVSYVPWFVPFP